MSNLIETFDSEDHTGIQNKDILLNIKKNSLENHTVLPVETHISNSSMTLAISFEISELSSASFTKKWAGRYSKNFGNTGFSGLERA